METGGPLLHSHQTNICSYHETVPNSPIPSLCLKVNFSIVPCFFLGLPVKELQGTSNMVHLNLLCDVMGPNGSEWHEAITMQ